MLSDEEREAIEIVKGITEDDLLNYWEGPEEPYNAIQIILNLIEKQQKEIERTNEILIWKQKHEEQLQKEIEELKNADLTTVYLNGFYDGEKKVKDKIKAKIEEYDDKGMTVNLVNRSVGKTFQQAVHYEVKKVLQSLLEKET